MPPPVTLAFLPYAEAAGRLAHQAAVAGHEVLVHMPMEPEDMAHNDPGPGVLTVGLPTHELQDRVRRALAVFPDAVGLNNHMGSRFTAEAEGMTPVLAELVHRNLFFLDSRTTAHSAGRAVAQQLGLRFVGRDVFLDNVEDMAAIRQQLAETERLARTRGQAVAIGHPHPETLTALRRWIPEVQARGFKLVPVSQLAVRLPTSSDRSNQRLR